MRINRVGLPLLLLLTSSLFMTTPSANGIERVKILAGNCSTCHGPQGQGYEVIPRIGGLDKDDILKLLKDFKSGEETSTIMDRHAKGYTQQEMEQLADYFSKME